MLISEKNRNMELINTLFKESNFDGFHFNGHFTLMFYRNLERKFEGNEIPKSFKLIIMSQWRFGTKNEWANYKSKFNTSKFIDDDEPVQAFTLTALR